MLRFWLSHENQIHGIEMSNSFGGNTPVCSLPQKTRNEVGTDGLYLSDLSDRDKVWDIHRANADKVAEFYRSSEEFQKYAERIDTCSRLLLFQLFAAENGYEFKLDNARFCRVNKCSTCQWRRALMWKSKAHKILPSVVEAYSDYRWLFLTLTVRNCLITDLRDTLQYMNKSWQRLVQRKKFSAVGFIRSTEVTRGQDNSAHPHFHCLLMVNSNYFKTKDCYLKQRDWVDLWGSCLKADYDPVVDIRAVRRDSSPCELIPEILKYCVKEADLVANREWFLELTRQTHRLRMISTGGVLKDYLKQLEEEPEDLIGKDELKTDDEIDEGHLYFEWKYQEKKYKLK